MSLATALAEAAVDVGAAVVKKLLADASDQEVIDALRAELASYRTVQTLHDDRVKNHFGDRIDLK